MLRGERFVGRRAHGAHLERAIQLVEGRRAESAISSRTEREPFGRSKRQPQARAPFEGSARIELGLAALAPVLSTPPPACISPAVDPDARDRVEVRRDRVPILKIRAEELLRPAGLAPELAGR